MMICTKGERYVTDTLRLTGWTVGDGSGHEGYDAWAYFDRAGRYLGPDQCGIEPEFDTASRTFILQSAKGSQTVRGELADAMRAAIAMEAELQPAYGVTITDAADLVYTCEDGRVAVCTENGDADDEDGTVMLVDGELVIAWDQGIRTPFADRGLAPA